jgi:hypothetical protein
MAPPLTVEVWRARPGHCTASGAKIDPLTARKTLIPVYLEIGAHRVFASAADWPGWTRAGKDEKTALEALAAAAPRYALATKAASVPFPSDSGSGFDVVERLPGSATTDYGAPGAIAKGDSRPLTRAEADRQCALLEGCWTVLDRVVAKAPAELRKGPRGGGRDRDKIADHVLDAEDAYAHKLGLRLARPDRRDPAEVRKFRAAILAAVRAATKAMPPVEKQWPARYAVRRTAWHALDHAWEIEDRTD